MAYTEQEVLAGLSEIVAEETGLAVETVTAEKSFVDDLDIDSLSIMTIVTHAEDKFEVTIPDEAAKEFVTVGDAVNFIVGAAA